MCSIRKGLAIGIGGAVGATARWAVVSAWPPDPFPWPVLVINVVGSVVLGAAMAEEWAHPRARTLLHDGVGIGFCGGLTTFSTFAVEVAGRGRDGDWVVAVTYAVASVVTCVAAVVLGATLAHRRSALDEPLEAAP